MVAADQQAHEMRNHEPDKADHPDGGNRQCGRQCRRDEYQVSESLDGHADDGGLQLAM